MAGAAQAAADGADFLLVGAMFATASHPGAAPAGPGLLREVAGVCRLPLIGIGGIAPGNLGQVIDAGASGVAVIRSILIAPDPAIRRRGTESVIGCRVGCGAAECGPSRNFSRRLTLPEAADYD